MLGLWRLQLLREVARRGTLREAASAMSVSPSAVSQQLSILETEAGLALLEKAGRRVRFTNAGEALVRHADIITGAVLAAETEMAQMRTSVSGTLRMAAFPTAARAVVPPVMSALGLRYPDLKLTLRDLEANESLAAVEMDEIDIAVVDEYGEPVQARHPTLEIQELFLDPIYVAECMATSPQESTVSTLRDAAWIMDADESAFYDAVARACRRQGFEPHVRSNCRDFSVIIALVQAGLGIAAMPGLALHDRHVHLRLRPMVPPLSRRVVAVVRPQRLAHPAIAAALRELRDFGSRYEPPRPDRSITDWSKI